MTTTLRTGARHASIEARNRAEAAAAARLVDEGHLVRLWKLTASPDKTKAMGLYRGDTRAHLDGLLGALPLYGWMPPRSLGSQLPTAPRAPGARTCVGPAGSVTSRRESFARMTDEQIEAALTEVPGVGRWTAHGFLIVALDRPDVLLSGDLALRHAVQRAYGLDHLPSEDEMVRLAEQWRPYRSLAVSYLFASEFEKGS